MTIMVEGRAHKTKKSLQKSVWANGGGFGTCGKAYVPLGKRRRGNTSRHDDAGNGLSTIQTPRQRDSLSVSLGSRLEQSL